MSIFKDVLNFVADTTGISSVGDAAKTVLNAITKNPEYEKQVREFELEKLKLEMKENASVRELFKTEVQSEDKFVRRARPSMVWLVFCIIAANFVLLPIVNIFTNAFGAEPIVITYPDLPENVYWLIGSIFGIYAGSRSWDKRNKYKSK